MEASSLPRHGGFAIPKPLLARAGDERLVDQLRRGNAAAFEVIYDRYHAGLLSFCRHMLGSREEAEDALQHTFVAAHEDIVRSTKPIRLKAWLYTIARNRCLSIIRARREQPSEDIEISTAGLSESVQQRADVRELLTDLHGLPEDQRAALVLSELGDLSHAEVALVVGCEVSKVKSLVFQARSSLIERRQAREIPCAEIREQLANLSGGALRRGHLRHHLTSCEGCREFRDDVRRQRKVMAAALPVIPTLGLKSSALAAVGAGGSGGAAVASGAAGGGLATVFGGSVAKVVVVAAVAAGAATGGSVATGSGVPFVGGDEPVAAEGAPKGGGGAPAVLPAKDDEDGARKSDGKKGFEPVRGESNGERAREFAKTRGKGKKKGLYKERAAKRRRARAERVTRTRPVRPAPRERSTDRTSPERTTPVKPVLPEKTVPVAPPPPPVVEEPVEPVAPPPPPTEPVVPGGSGGKGGGSGKVN